jgi:hypothetical protein
MAAKKAGLEVVRLDDKINVARREDRKKKKLQTKLRQAVDQVALDHNLTVEDVVRSSITRKTTPNIHRAVEGNRVNTMIAASVEGYDTLSAYKSILTLHRLFGELNSLSQSEHIAPLLTALGKGVPAQTQKELWGATDRAIRLARETPSIQKITAAVPQENINVKKPRGRGSAHQRNSNAYQASSTLLLLFLRNIQ